MKKIKKKVDLLDRIQLTASFVLKITLITAFISAIHQQNWLTLFVVAVTLFVSFLPAIIRRNYRIFIPIEFEFVLLIFVYASLFLGELHGYYTTFWWWDIMLHGLSSISFGFLGFLVLYILYCEEKIKTSPILIAVCSFCFAVAMGSMWEIFEFSMDHFFEFNMQKSGLIDTMGDIIVNASGAFIIATIGYIYMKRGYTFLFKRLINKFLMANPRLVRRYNE
ncbi:MAG: hypothetical protein AABW64_04505 [Nanoarchaeota archaeon]